MFYVINSPNFDVKSIILFQFWPGALSQIAEKKNGFHSGNQ